MAWYLNTYYCDVCDNEWQDEWCSACNDRCGECSAEIEPLHTEDADEQGTCGDAACPDCARKD